MYNFSIHSFSRIVFLLIFIGEITVSGISQDRSITGTVLDKAKNPIAFATVILSQSADSTVVKAAITDDAGAYTFELLKPTSYYLDISYVGMQNFRSTPIDVSSRSRSVDPITLEETSKAIQEVTVTATRALVEVKPDRTVFNVQGTINASGEDGLNLLRKAPGVLVDNNNNVTVLGRAGVLLYVDGKRIPLSGDDLTQYLQNLTSEQIDKIDIITNPGSKYEAQGNAGIIDIKLKKDKNQGANGNVGGSISQGRYRTGNLNASGNLRTGITNIFASLGYNEGTRWNDMDFINQQNGLNLVETNVMLSEFEGLNGRIGTDFYLSKNSTIGFLVSAQNNQNDNRSTNIIDISSQTTPTQIDSILNALNQTKSERKQQTYNLNYAWNNGSNSLNFDLDYGNFKTDASTFQPNLYYDPTNSNLISQNITTFNTPVTIQISTAKLDYETKLAGGTLGLGSKVSKVNTDNTFLFSNVDPSTGIVELNRRRSNRFEYDEMVYALYTQYQRTISERWSGSLGLRAEQTEATGTLSAYLPELAEDPAVFSYLNLFPTAGINFTKNPEQVYSLNFGRRINRPDYNVLNPFREQLSELSYSRGNKNLLPEIVNNVELGYLWKYKYSFKLSYSLTTNQITRLFGPDSEDPRAGFISWDNLATQTIYNFNAALPFDFTSWWNAFFNVSVSYIDNQADYGTNGIVDVQTGNYNIFQQHTLTLGKGWRGEVSMWYSGPGVWGGVFLYDPSYGLNFGIQKKFLQDRLNVRLNVSDVTFQSGWSGISEFNGLRNVGRGNWDSRRAALTLSYDLGNAQIKSRKRTTGLETESNRVSG